MARLPLLMSAASGSSVNVNGSAVPSPNFNGTTPAAPGGDTNVVFQVSGSSISAYVPSQTVPQTIAAVASMWLNSYNAVTGLFTATQPAAADLSNGTTGTGAVVLASAIAGFGSGTVTSFSAGNLSPLFTSSVATATTTPALTFSLSTQNANLVFAGPASGGAGAPSFRALVTADIPAADFAWSALTNATANLTLANAGFTTTFNQTSAVAWDWENTTTASAITTNASPTLGLSAQYWTGAASANDLWTFGSVLSAGTNGVSTFTLLHTGTTGKSWFQIPGASQTGGLQFVTTGDIDCSNGTSGAVSFTFGGGSLGTKLLYNGAYSTLEAAGNGASLQLCTNNQGTIYLNTTASYVPTSGTQTAVSVAPFTGGVAGTVTFNPPSGTASFVGLSILPTIQGTTSGNTTAFLVNPTITTTNLTGVNLLANFTGTVNTVANQGLSIGYAAAAPTSAGTAGVLGEIVQFGGHLYFCSVAGAAGAATWNVLSMGAV